MKVADGYFVRRSEIPPGSVDLAQVGTGFFSVGGFRWCRRWWVFFFVLLKNCNFGAERDPPPISGVGWSYKFFVEIF